MTILFKKVFFLIFAIYIIFMPQKGFAHGSELIVMFTDWDKVNKRVIEVCESKYPDSIATLKINIDKWKAEKRDNWLELRAILKEISNLDKSSLSKYPFVYKHLDSDFTADVIKIIESYSLEELHGYCSGSHAEFLTIDLKEDTQLLKNELEQIKLRKKANSNSK